MVSMRGKRWQHRDCQTLPEATMMRRWDVLGIGAVAVDDLIYLDGFPTPEAKMYIAEETRQGGGLAGTALVAAARLGVRAGYIGVLGDDELSRYTIAELTSRPMFEFVHPDDVGLAVANAVANDQVRGKILLIGGGHSSQLYFQDFVGRMMEAMGIGRLPDRAFATTACAFSDWIDTTESQGLLRYQRHSFGEFTKEIAASLGPLRPVMRIMSPLIRWWMLNQSPYYKATRTGKAVTTR